MSKLQFFSKQKILRTNLLFIFIFLNIWEFILAREIFNGMILGIVIFGPVAFLWFMKTLRAAMLATAVSIFEAVILAVFVIEGFEFGGAAATLKSLFWVPYLAMAAVNMMVGLMIYGDFKAKKVKKTK